MRLVVAVVVNALALLASGIVPGIEFHGTITNLLLCGALFGLFNLLIRPIVMWLALPAMIVSFGLFYFVLNGLLLWGASHFLPGYSVSGIVAGMLGSLVIALFNWSAGILFGTKKRRAADS